MLQNIAFVLETLSLQSDLHMQVYGAGLKLNMAYIEYSMYSDQSYRILFSTRKVITVKWDIW
jgi:hypothetical protein